MWNILWILLPIIGWFALGGYGIRIVKEFTKGKFKRLPVLSFKSDFKLGFVMFIKSLPFVIAYSIVLSLLDISILWVEVPVRIFADLFILPILFIHFFNRETVKSLFEFKILKSIFTNIGDYIITLLKSILLGIIFLVMIIVLVGLPAGAFTQDMFLADFYRRRVK